MTEINAEFMDIFGFIGFLFITLFSIYILNENKLPKRVFQIILLLIGVLGLIIDGFIVYINFIR